MEKRKLKTLSIQQKLELMEEVDKGRRKKSEIAAQFGISPSTLSTILKNRTILQQKLDNTPHINLSKKRFTRCVFEDVDECVLNWTMSMLDKDVVPLTNRMIREKAKSFARILGRWKFRASTGWLEKFKMRYGILQRSQEPGTGDFLETFPSKSTEMGRSMVGDRLGKEVKSECEGNAADGDYLDRGCDVILLDAGAIKTEMETSWENSEQGETKPVFGSDEAQTALQAIRKYLDNREAVPGDVYDALGVIDDFVMKTELI